MKNCDEITNDLLKRRDRYVVEQRKKRQRVMGAATALCGCCLVAGMGFGMWNDGMFRSLPEQINSSPDQVEADPLCSCVKDHFDASKGESDNTSVADRRIIIHQIDGIFADRYNICLLVDDFVAMSTDEMKQYYGVDYIPEVPPDMRAWGDQQKGIYKRDGGSGEVYWDSDILNYSNADSSRTLHLEVAKDGLPLIDYLSFVPTAEKSLINNTEVMLGQTESGYYYAQFMYRNVGFVLSAQGVSEDEFVAVIASILGE